MTDVDEQGRPEPPLTADETATLLGFLDFQRATLAWKCGGLDGGGLGATTAASSITLGGLLKHLANVEDLWFSRRLHGGDPAPPWDTVDWKADADWDWHSAAEDSPEELFALWQDAVDRSRSLVAEALADGGLERPAAWIDDWYGVAPSLRWILVHMIEEYARHNGHADLLRESVDGLTGEQLSGIRPPSIVLMKEPRPQRNRIHIDIFVPHDQAEARVARPSPQAATWSADKNAPASWTLADAEDKQADMATWMGRD